MFLCQNILVLPLVVICQKVCGKCICTISERKFCKNQYSQKTHTVVRFCVKIRFCNKKQPLLEAVFCDLQLPCIICLTVFVLFSVPSVYFFTHLFPLSKLYVAFCLRVFFEKVAVAVQKVNFKRCNHHQTDGHAFLRIFVA